MIQRNLPYLFFLQPFANRHISVQFYLVRETEACAYVLEVFVDLWTWRVEGAEIGIWREGERVEDGGNLE